MRVICSRCLWITVSAWLVCLWINPALAQAAEEKKLVSSLALPQEIAAVMEVRVFLRKTAELTLTTDPVTNIYDDEKGTFLGLVAKNTLTVRIIDGMFEIDGKKIASQRILLNSSGAFSFDQGRYAGKIILHRTGNEMLVINECDLEDYVRGVLPSEVFSNWPMEALKTQAVAARTYGVFCVLKNRDKLYHVMDTVASQVYGGLNRQHPMTNRATLETRSEILTYENKVFPTFFHATCGGHTTEAELVWNIESHPCLRKVFCPHCWQAPHYLWQKSFSKNAVESILKQKKLVTAPFQTVVAGKSDHYGRLSEVIIKTSGAPEIAVRAHDFRLMLGAEQMRSAFCQIVDEGDAIFMKGFGWGHGVGLCQWGMKVMAEKGNSYENILAFYFPDSIKIHLNPESHLSR